MRIPLWASRTGLGQTLDTFDRNRIIVQVQPADDSAAQALNWASQQADLAKALGNDWTTWQGVSSQVSSTQPIADAVLARMKSENPADWIAPSPAEQAAIDQYVSSAAQLWSISNYAQAAAPGGFFSQPPTVEFPPGAEAPAPTTTQEWPPPDFQGPEETDMAPASSSSGGGPDLATLLPAAAGILAPFLQKRPPAPTLPGKPAPTFPGLSTPGPLGLAWWGWGLIGLGTIAAGAVAIRGVRSWA